MATFVVEVVLLCELFVVVVAEVGWLLGADLVGMIRYEVDVIVIVVVTWVAVGEHFEVRGWWSLEGDCLVIVIVEICSLVCEDDWVCVVGPIVEFVCEQLGIDFLVGSLVVVEGRVWGVLFVYSMYGELFLLSIEEWFVDFIGFVVTAISNGEAWVEVARFVDEQVALWCVAMFVVQGVLLSDVFGAVVEGVVVLLGVDLVGMICYEKGAIATPVATWVVSWYVDVVSLLVLLIVVG